jgi:hypothetical protein
MAYTPIRKNGMLAKKPGKKPNPNTKPKRPATFVKGVPRPHVWICGPDEYKHQMYQPWLLAKAQARFRGEEWFLEFEEYYELWKDDWPNRGRRPEDMCMTRRDPEFAWDKDNAYIITRKEHFSNQGPNRSHVGMTYNTKKRRGLK